MTFDELLGLADDEALQELIGPKVIRLLQLIDPALAMPSRLRALISDLSRPQDLLLDKSSRALLMSLLPRSSAEELAGKLGGQVDSNPYITLQRCSVRRGSRQEYALLSFFGLAPLTDEPTETAAGTEVVTPVYRLFPHQRLASLKITERLNTGQRRALLHMPTGAGKTRTAMNVICDHLRANQNTLVVWLAYSEELCEQAVQEFIKAWGQLGDRTVSVYRYWGAHELPPMETLDGLFVGGLSKTYNASQRSLAWLAALADKTSLVIIDEAHQAIAETYSLVLEGLKTKHIDTALLGLTATPGRTWSEMDEDQRLASFFNRQKVTLVTPGAPNPVEFLISSGYLARPLFVPLHHGGGTTITAQDQHDLARELDIPLRILEKLAEDEQRNAAILHRVEELTRRHKRIIVFCTTVEHAVVLAAVLRARTVDAASITGKSTKQERQAIISHFRSNSDDAQVICNYGVLTTGFDAPKTSAAVIARPTKSLVLYSQMLGRAIRGPKAGGSPNAEIVTVVDPALPGFGDLGEAFMNWEDVWE